MKGWLSAKGIRENADRTLDEQMLGLGPALAACKGKTVLDLGCAEGLIGLEFSKAGAAKVLGIEMLEGHLAVARQACAVEIANGKMAFICSELKTWIDQHPQPEQFDIVLALGIAHKLHDPADLMSFACRSAKELVVFRSPGKKSLAWDGNIKAKHRDTTCHVPTLMTAHGFVVGETLPSAREEMAQYWWRE
jgi:2-polyprenyl-3-methyl-5-hydroxy-6-metoxy-1,4-benzoquinol methylase